MVEPDRHALERIERHFVESAAVKRDVGERCAGTILAAASLVAAAFRGGNKVLLCGNGGSAADCQHMAAEFVSRLSVEFDRPGLPAIALTTDTSFLTAFANDCGFEGVFERQVRTLGRPGDVLVAISTSGNSPNVLRASEAAVELGMAVVSLTGAGGRLPGLASVAVAVPSSNTQHVQESHLAIEHLICELVEQDLFGERAR